MKDHSNKYFQIRGKMDTDIFVANCTASRLMPPCCFLFQEISRNAFFFKRICCIYNKCSFGTLIKCRRFLLTTLCIHLERSNDSMSCVCSKGNSAFDGTAFWLKFSLRSTFRRPNAFQHWAWNIGRAFDLWVKVPHWRPCLHCKTRCLPQKVWKDDLDIKAFPDFTRFRSVS